MTTMRVPVRGWPAPPRRGHRLGAASIAIALAIAAGGAGRAAANGRFPSSVSVDFRPGDPDDIYLGTTFGFLVSRDDGAHVYWVCEKAVGYEGTFDPVYRVASDGTIYASTYDGLRVSRDQGCSFETATSSLPEGDPGRIAGVWIDGLDVGPTGEVWVATAEGGRSNDVYRSTDGARTFTPAGLRSTVMWWKSVLVSPADSRRVYVAGYQVSQTGPMGEEIPPSVHLRRTDDGGGQWEELSVTGLQLGSSPLLLVVAVDPARPEILYVRSVRAVPPEGDLLYRSDDGGRSWTAVLSTVDGIRGIVIRGSEVLVASRMGGMHRSTDDGLSFAPLPAAPQAACLADRDGTLFACGANWEPERFSLGRSADATTWQKVFRFIELDGPLACPTGTVQHDVCEVELWPTLRSQFGIPSDAGVDAGTEPPATPGGCCDASGAAGPPAVAALLAALALRRPRRRRSSPPRLT